MQLIIVINEFLDIDSFLVFINTFCLLLLDEIFTGWYAVLKEEKLEQILMEHIIINLNLR